MESKTQDTFRTDRRAWFVDNRYSILLGGMLWLLIVTMIVPDGFNYDNTMAGALPTSGSALSRFIWLGLLGMGIVFTVWRAGLAGLLVRNLNPFLLIFVALATLSIIWSIDSGLTGRRLVRLLTIVLVCSAFVLSGWHARRFQNVIRPILTLMLFGSIIFCLVNPATAIHWEWKPELFGAWHGLATQKNVLGALACFGMIFWFHAWLTREVRTLSALIGGAISGTCLVFSRSSTSMITTVVAMLLMVMLLRSPPTLRAARPFLVSILALLILVYAIAILKLVPGMSVILEPIMALTGKDMTFPGRAEIWAILSEHISLNPFFGTGYEAYWTPVPIMGTDSFVFLARMQGFYPGEAHNGYLEVMNDLGWAGLICLLAYLFTYIRQALQLLEIDSNQSALYLALFFQQAITNLSESHWFVALNFDFVIMTVATMALARSLLEHRLQTIFGNPATSPNKVKYEIPRRRLKTPVQTINLRC